MVKTVGKLLIVSVYLLVLTVVCFLGLSPVNANELVSWTSQSDWSEFAAGEDFSIDGDRLQWNLHPFVEFSENTADDWNNSYSTERLGVVNDNLQLQTTPPTEYIFTNTGTGHNGTIQNWVVPSTGTYRITAWGAQGGMSGGTGGLGAMMSGDFQLTEGENILILVGHQGQMTGGGGGTFVATGSTHTTADPLLVAGGGGGASNSTNPGNGSPGLTGPDGGAPHGTNWATRGTNGQGGNDNNAHGGAGAGFYSGASGSALSWGSKTQGFRQGGQGGTSTCSAGPGGFGGGAMGGCRSGGGGGGYSGGAQKGGGGSFNDGTNQHNQSGVRTGHGRVEIIGSPPPGERISQPVSLGEIQDLTSSLIEWQSTEPSGTGIDIFTAVNTDNNTPPTNWQPAVNGAPLPGLAPGDDLSNQYLWIRQLFRTEDETINPQLHSLAVDVNPLSETGYWRSNVISMLAGKPELVAMDYSTRDQIISLDVIGSPGQPSEEKFQAINLTEQEDLTLPWSASHSEFQIQINFESLDRQSVPEFRSLSLLRPAEFYIDLKEDETLLAGIEGIELYLGVEVSNVNNVSYSQLVQFEVDGQLFDSRPLLLSGGETEFLKFKYNPPPATDFVDFSVSTDNDIFSQQFVVFDQPQFQLKIDQLTTDTEVVEGEDVSITALVSSLEPVKYGQTIEFYFDGVFIDKSDLILPVGETVPVSFLYQQALAEETGAEMQLGWEGTYDAVELTVLTFPYFEIQVDQVVNQDGSDTVDQGDTAVIVVTVENTGDLPGTQEINFLVEGTHQGSHQLTLDGHTEQTVEFDYLTARKDDGAVLWVESEDSYDSWPLRVYLDPKFIVQIDQSSSLLRVVKQQEVQVIAGIDNTGDYPDIQTIELVVDQQVVATAQVGLPGRSGTVVELSYLTAREDDGINLLVRSFDTSDSVNIDVLDFAGGAGSLVEPYLVNNWYQLDQLRREPAAKYKLMQSLDQTSPGYDGLAGSTANGGLGWKPVGTAVTPFTGGFDGRGESLSGLRVERPGSGAAGLFGFVGESGEITSLELLDAEVSGSNNVGLLVGQISEGTITDCRVDGTVMGDGIYSGGLVGRVIGGQLERLQADVELVSSGLYAGGLAGGNSGRIVNSTARGTVSGEFRTGGFVGENLSGGELVDLYSTVDVRGEGFQTGGLVAYNAGLIRRAYASGEVKGARVKGGLVGHSPVGGGVVEDSFWDSQQTLQAASVGGTARTPGGMRDIETYRAAGWNIEETDQLKNAAYPFLAAEVTGNSPVWYITGAAYHDWSVGEQILDDLDDPDTAPVLITERVYSYPNPYRGDLGGPVSFYLPQDYGDLVQLDLFNLQGRRIVRESLVVDSDRLASWWPSVASGSYIYRVSGGGRSSSNTLTIIR